MRWEVIEMQSELKQQRWGDQKYQWEPGTPGHQSPWWQSCGRGRRSRLQLVGLWTPWVPKVLLMWQNWGKGEKEGGRRGAEGDCRPRNNEGQGQIHRSLPWLCTVLHTCVDLGGYVHLDAFTHPLFLPLFVQATLIECFTSPQFHRNTLQMQNQADFAAPLELLGV